MPCAPLFLWHEVCRQNLMKKAFLAAVIFATGLFALGCKKSEANATGPVQTNMEFNYTYDKREVFIDDASIDMAELDQKINELSEKVTAAGTTVKAAAQPKIEDLRKLRIALGRKLEKLKGSTEADWNELKADYQKADSQMKVSLHESSKWVQDNTRT